MAKPERFLPPDLDIREYLLGLPPHWRVRAIDALGPQAREAFDRAWSAWAHKGQQEPDGGWSTWVIKAGRGFGKTRAGAEWIVGRIAGEQAIRIALVGATLEDARRVMVEGRSGLIEVGAGWVSDWEPSLGRLRFRTGAEAQLFSGASPAMLRGPEHHYAWCDELAKWEKAKDCWDMLQLGLRLGAQPRVLVTTTPVPGPVLKAIMDTPGTITTGGSTRANPHTSASFKRRVEALYAGTRLGRQELEGELLPDAAGALWSVELIERCRVASPSPSGEGLGWGSEASELPGEQAPPQTPPLKGRGFFLPTLIAVDPPSGDGTCGIIACAREGEGVEAIGHVLADHSVTGRSPEGWARAVAAAAEAHGTRDVVAERNQGGDMVRAVLHTSEPRLKVRLRTASKGKAARAEPVAHLFEAGRVRFHGHWPDLEEELRGLIAGGGYEGPGTSPDRADAMVWGLTELMLEGRGAARVREL
ncbi:MAG: DNA-packaging protein [Sphingomonas sp.]|uniref:terminase large subunit domain-containing protein n=1 Tax=Sphingomonas sp. TaxID=28214 RepID=UPI001B0125FA|nr:terminase family protein [Sphingomonas sp.]MBO9622770.1 DNA-packaging protein [Sphingomonas sp.]